MAAFVPRNSVRGFTHPLEMVTPGIYDWDGRSYKKRQLDQIKLGCVSFTPSILTHSKDISSRKTDCQLLPHSVFIIGVEVGGDKRGEEA